MIKTKRINDQPGPDDGYRVLISRYWPRGWRKYDATWDVWDKRLDPSVDLHAAWYGRQRLGRRVVARGLPGISWDEYEARFLEEMQSPESQLALEELCQRSFQGETITLLCFCENEVQCHRSLVCRLIEIAK